MKKYNIINNTLGWLVFAIAAVTYLLTLEPTASFWDCPEFISQGYKLEIGHPPGNPMFILAARFAANFAGGDVALVSKYVNAMSAILSALTVLLLFWSITHLVKRLIVKDGGEADMSLGQYMAVMGSGVCGALVYTWSDTFWYSAVEAEVYAFSSFCTALVFWLILKWEARADDPSSDRYLILIAYVFGVSLGVHLLNLLAIPAIALIIYYRRYSGRTNVKGSLISLLLSFVVIVLILYGLEPGFIELAGYFELMAVNGMGLSYNSGVIIYAALLMLVLAWTLFELYRGSSRVRMLAAFFLSVVLSGMLFLSDGLLLPILLIIAFGVLLFLKVKVVPRRLLSIVTLSIMMIFIGFSSYALVLIRSSANTPLDENSPNSPFALTSYLSREQYGKSPLLYGNTFGSQVLRVSDGTPYGTTQVDEGPNRYTRVVKTDTDVKDHYENLGPREDYVMTPELNMLFPRIHSSMHTQQYYDLLGEDFAEQIDATVAVDENGESVMTDAMPKPTFGSNLRYFFSYQLNYMYFRYFLWNFAGRQNDLQGNGPGDAMRGNWITGIPFMDNARLGDQKMLPDEFTTENKGNNKFYLLPLLLGIIGLIWQACKRQRGIEQFWVVFFLFFMTGIAIVLYLNQTPSQPRERDYAYAGSFYAFAIWVGMGVAALWNLSHRLGKGKQSLVGIAAAAVGVLVPLQMVSQTWDDHDRSGRYCARDFGMNYLAGLEKNAIIFCNGDNDTFPLWYAQEVEGYRTDVRAVNLSYLATDWYIAQMQRAAYDSKPLPMRAGALTYAYDKRQYGYWLEPDSTVVSPEQFLDAYYDDKTFMDPQVGVPVIKYSTVRIPTNKEKAIAAGIVPESMRDAAASEIVLDLGQGGKKGGMSASEMASFDLIATSIANGWQRPCYFAMTVPESYYLGLSPWLLNVGMAYQVTPVRSNDGGSREIHSNTDRMFDVVTKHFRWGGLDKAKPGAIYVDETVGRMINSTRTAMTQLARDLVAEEKYDKANIILDLMMQKLPVKTCNLSFYNGLEIAESYHAIAENSDNADAGKKAISILESEILRFGQYVRYNSYMMRNDYMPDEMSVAIETQVLPEFLLTYKQYNPDGYEALLKKLAAQGVDAEHIASFRNLRPQRQYTPEEIEMLRQQAAQQQNAPEPDEQPADEQPAAEATEQDLANPFGL
ncbi:MAG: DUF2723 domain-containing protein [Muribaculaceae bacterium]|nr:DUF2723 domain-containing protein [Muribaculaceae bacterium]